MGKQKFLGITLDKDLKFDKHASEIWSKENRKLNVLSRMQSFLSAGKRRIILKSFIESQFKYCPLTWMFHSQISNNKISSYMKGLLRIVNNDYESSYEDLVSHNNCFSIHDHNMHRLATEIFKVANDLSVGDFKNLFDFKDQYTLHIPLVNTELKGKNVIGYFSAVIWNAIPVNIKIATSLNGLKNRIKSWKAECLWQLCKTFLQGVDFINVIIKYFISEYFIILVFNKILHILLYFFFDIQCTPLFIHNNLNINFNQFICFCLSVYIGWVFFMLCLIVVTRFLVHFSY